jgi:hypothetical protein
MLLLFLFAGEYCPLQSGGNVPQLIQLFVSLNHLRQHVLSMVANGVRVTPTLHSLNRQDIAVMTWFLQASIARLEVKKRATPASTTAQH